MNLFNFSEILSPRQTIFYIGFFVFCFFCRHFSFRIKIGFIRGKNKRLRNMPYFKKNWFCKAFLLGTKELIELDVFVLNFITKIIELVSVLIGVLHIIFCVQILSALIKILCIVDFITHTILVFVLKEHLPYTYQRYSR